MEIFYVKFHKYNFITKEYSFIIPRIADYVIILDQDIELFMCENKINSNVMINQNDNPGYIFNARKKNNQHLKILGIFEKNESTN
jgi:hypothetical protein